MDKINEFLSSPNVFLQVIAIASFVATVFSYSYGQYYLNLQHVDASLYFSIPDYIAMYSEKIVMLFIVLSIYIGIRYEIIKRNGFSFDLHEEFSEALWYIPVLSLFLHSYTLRFSSITSFHSFTKEAIIFGVLQFTSMAIHRLRSKLTTSFIYIASLCCILNISVSYALIDFVVFYPQSPTYIICTKDFTYQARIIASSSQYLIIDNSGLNNNLVLPLQRVKSIRLVRKRFKNTTNKKSGETIYS